LVFVEGGRNGRVRYGVGFGDEERRERKGRKGKRIGNLSLTCMNGNRGEERGRERGGEVGRW
jgi:hypothetical protein